MSARSWSLAIVGGVLVAAGLFALRFPVQLDAFDQWGWLIKCGNGFSGNLLQADQATNGSGYVEQCEAALLSRRMWTIPMIAVGAVAGVGALLVSALSSVRETLS